MSGDTPADPFGYADDFGNIPGPTDLTEAEDDYRRRAYEAVMHYAGEYGIPVFPVWWMATKEACACKEGLNCGNKAKHPIDVGWPEVATADPEQAARWWRKLGHGDEITDWRPRANVGLAMGDGHFLLDVDMGPDQQGDISLGALISHYDNEDMPHTLLYDTGGGGRQAVMIIPEGTEVRNSVSELGANLDIRGRRGYGIAPPSVSGKGSYRTAVDAPPAAPPRWLARWLTEQQEKRAKRLEARPESSKARPLPENLSPRAHGYVQGALADAVKKVSEAPDHGRNNCLNAQAWALFSRFGVCGLLDPGEIAAALKDAASACGLTGEEVPKTLASAWDGAEDLSGDLPDFVFEAAGKFPVKPDPLVDPATPWLAKDPGTAVTGLNPDGRVEIDPDVKTDNRGADVLRLSWAVALGYASPHIAVQGRELVVVSGAEQGSLDISPLDAVRLRNLCANGLTYCHVVEEGLEEDADGKPHPIVLEYDRATLPTIQLCRTTLADPAIRLYRPVLAGISRVPVLRPDRTLLEVQGVDASTMRVYWPDLPIGTIPAKPTRSEVAAAKKLILDELLADFPWSSNADKANTLGMWLTSYLEPFARFLSPLFVVNAVKSSSGKGQLVTVMAETVGAYFRTWVNLEEEIRKSLTTCLKSSDPVIILDDVGKKDTVASATLASMLTKRQWDDRLLGGNQNFRGENNRTWCLTGNNVRLGGDIPSRSVLIHLDPGATDPKLRDPAKFKLGDISVWITREENKVAVVRALLVLIADWAAHGCPRSAVQHRFAEWAAVVGGVLEHHKIDGFLANQKQVEEHVYYDEHLGDFFRKWHELYKSEPQGVKKLRDSLGKSPEMGNSLTWKETWPRNKKGGLMGFRDLRTELADALGQDHGGYQVDEAPDGHGGVLYKVSVVVDPEVPVEVPQVKTT